MWKSYFKSFWEHDILKIRFINKYICAIKYSYDQSQDLCPTTNIAHLYPYFANINGQKV